MLPTKTNAERLAGQAKLREQFPVSSGSQHRTKGRVSLTIAIKNFCYLLLTIGLYFVGMSVQHIKLFLWFNSVHDS